MVDEALGEQVVPLRVHSASLLVCPLAASMLSSARSVPHALLVVFVWRCPQLFLSISHPLHGHTSKLFFFTKTITKMLLLLESRVANVRNLSCSNSLFTPGKLKMFPRRHKGVFRICHICAKLQIFSGLSMELGGKYLILPGHDCTITLSSFLEIDQVHDRFVAFLM
eukprot:s3037_g8.t1